jgi:hypothetical protein
MPARSRERIRAQWSESDTAGPSLALASLSNSFNFIVPAWVKPQPLNEEIVGWENRFLAQNCDQSKAIAYRQQCPAKKFRLTFAANSIILSATISASDESQDVTLANVTSRCQGLSRHHRRRAIKPIQNIRDHAPWMTSSTVIRN